MQQASIIGKIHGHAAEVLYWLGEADERVREAGWDVEMRRVNL